MILVAGASGRLGNRVARLLLARGTPVRAMSRDVSRLAELTRLGAEPVAADLRDPASLARACENVEKVVAAAHAFTGTGDNNPVSVDDAGNRHLIDACRNAGVEHFVFTSVHGARPDHPLDFFRIKFRVEEYLRTSGLSYGILRPSAFMEFWAALLGQPIVEKGRTTIFTEYGGKRGAILIVDLPDASKLPAIAEPWFLQFNADVSFHAVMTPDDLGRASLDALGKNWGWVRFDDPRFVLALLFAVSASAVEAEDWPQFRGPTGQGHSAEQASRSSGARRRTCVWKMPRSRFGVVVAGRRGTAASG